MNEIREQLTRGYLADIKSLIDSIEEDLVMKLDEVSTILTDAREKKRTIFLMGNGGSAATASHFAQDLAKGTIAEGKPRFRALSLVDNISGIMAWSNDSSYEDIFIEQLKNLMEPGDIVIGISGSGNSMNVIKAIDYANDNGGVTIGLSGYDGGKLLQRARNTIHVPVSHMQKVEDLHMLVLHLLMCILRDEDCEAAPDELPSRERD